MSKMSSKGPLLPFLALLAVATAGVQGCESGGSKGLGGKGGTSATGGMAGGGTSGSGGSSGGAGGHGGSAGAGGQGGQSGQGGMIAVNCGAGGFIGSAGSLLSDGGFECPMVARGNYVNYSVGQQFFGWTAVGAPGQASVLSGDYVNGNYTWPAHGGAQTIDLTGDGSNSATGVAQTVTTMPGKIYHLSFWVGNMDAPGSLWGATSTVNVLVDGVQQLSALNRDGGAGSTSIGWTQFSVDFTAANAMTTVSFINGDPANDNSNLLDDVVLD